MKDHKKYNGRIKSAADELTGLHLPECFLTVEAFVLHQNSLYFSYGDWIGTAAFDDGKNCLGLFRKHYSLTEAEFADFQTHNAEILQTFIVVARALSNATQTAEFRMAFISPINYEIRFQFYENGRFFSFHQDSEAYLSTVEDETFSELKTAMASICLAIAMQKDSAFWSNTINAD